MNNELRYRRLSPILYNKNFVDKDPLCNYELYLRELINKSKCFLELSKGEKYEAPESEEHGQDDAVSKNYSMDFKLAEATTMIETQKCFSNSVSKLCDGVIVKGDSEKQGESISTILHAALRQIKCIEDIDRICKTRSIYTKLENRKEGFQEQIILDDLKRFINILKKDKNLLLFMPIVFFLKDNIDNAVGEEMIKEALYSDFNLVFKYRYERCSSKDTFLSCVYMDSLMVLKYENDKLIKVDSVSLEYSPAYNYIVDTYDIK